ncbi:hypothetical protein [Aquicella lusitana]|uniref:Uncharacterized protein n=1 Tax=Aquicella lusitana TaxID=254246 RepID=A0A370GWL0_9COXI|nr:hypothetical protein [Aquicella lusitana]RDI48047.1 hypothetical protein C8D86_10311 [Aquicella lusitana]VVC72936.1 hypothetical protein AQULUS_06610 [Aquicella lusitana]
MKLFKKNPYIPLKTEENYVETKNTFEPGTKKNAAGFVKMEHVKQSRTPVQICVPDTNGIGGDSSEVISLLPRRFS